MRNLIGITDNLSKDYTTDKALKDVSARIDTLRRSFHAADGPKRNMLMSEIDLLVMEEGKLKNLAHIANTAKANKAAKS